MSNVFEIPSTPIQRDILQSTAPELFLIGGLGSGKSMALALLAWMQSMKYPGNYGMVAMATNPQLDRSIIHDTFNLYRKLGFQFTYNESKRLVTFPNGSIYLFQTLDIPWQELKGPTFGWVCVDEVDLCSKEKWEMICGRVRRPGVDRIVRGFGNPVPEGHWIMDNYREFKSNPQGKTQFLTATTYDNPFLPQSYIERLEGMYPPGTNSHRRWMMGEMGMPIEGAVYPEFSLAEHVIAEEEQLPIIGYINGIDFGYNNAFCFLRAGLTGDDVLVVTAEHYKARELLSCHVEAIRKLYKEGIIVADHDAQSRAELENLGVSTVPAVKDIATGIDAVARRFRDGRIKIVGSACPNLIRELGSYRWKEGTKNSDPHELPYKQDDHACDALRYIVMALDAPREGMTWEQAQMLLEAMEDNSLPSEKRGRRR